MPGLIKLLPQPLLVVVYFAFIFVFMFFDVITGPDFSFLIFYLLPILAAAWFSGRIVSYAVAVGGAGAWFYADAVSHLSYAHPLAPYWNVAEKLCILLIAAHILGRLAESLDRERKLARKDELTGAANRRAFFEAAKIEMDRMHRYKHPFTLAYIDLDNFKDTNDSQGHEIGDRVLKASASAVAGNIRSTDIFARIGGDEFVLLLAETGADQARPVMEKIRAALLDSMQKERWPITFSIGVVTYLRSPGNVDELVKKADDLMYAAKRGGKNCVSYAAWNESATAR